MYQTTNDTQENLASETLSPWWRYAVLAVMVVGFAVLILLTTKVHHDAPPIPEKLVSTNGEIIFSGKDIQAGQQVFLKYGLMDNGTIWGHGGYLGPDFSAQYLHNLAIDVGNTFAQQRFGQPFATLAKEDRPLIDGLVQAELKHNRYDPQTRTLTFTDTEIASYRRQIGWWRDYFSKPGGNGGLPVNFIADPEELRKLTAFFAWTAWASVAPRPHESYSYTNNFPYDPAVGNTPTGAALLWSAISLMFLLVGTALVLLAFGKFDYLGWKPSKAQAHLSLLPGNATPSQKATIKFFVVVALLFLVQTLVGGATAHYRADPETFYGIDISALLPSNILRTWHLQLAIFWIATAYVAGALLLAPALSEQEPKGQVKRINILFTGLVVVVAGSLLGEWLGIYQWLPKSWFWFGHQGWEYLELGRAWQILLAAALVFWFLLVVRGVAPSLKNPEQREITRLFLLAALAIPVFYLPAMFFDGTTHYSVVDTWRFWIIHLWVEGFFEFFVTVLVAVIFFRLGVVSRVTAIRVIYLDAILYFGGGLIGTGHHWYFTGHTPLNMALSAAFSALEVVPLTLLTLDAWDFIKLTRASPDGQTVGIPQKWTFYFLMAVGFWNFTGAGVFGFLINLPIVSYFEIGTMLTVNHGHAAMMGVFGMLAIGLLVFAIRHVSNDSQWARLEKYVKVSFWGLNSGLLLMVIMSLFPAGVLQLLDTLKHGYWHARSLAYTGQETARFIEWLRTPGDLIFIFVGVVPIVIAVTLCYLNLSAARAEERGAIARE